MAGLTKPASFSSDADTERRIKELQEYFTRNTGLPTRQISKSMTITMAIKRAHDAIFGKAN